MKTDDVDYIYIHMGNFLTTCSGQNVVMAGKTYIKIHQEELLYYTVFEFK